MTVSEKWGKIKSKLPAIGDALKELLAWLFAAFLLPLVQLFIIAFSIDPSVVYENVYNILFVTIASFLTSVFFVTNFWKQNRLLVRMMLVFSYLISFGLFLFSLVHIMFNKAIFDLVVYKWGAIIALILAIIVGFYSKYDERLAVPREIAEQAKKMTQGTINGTPVKI